MTPDLNKLGVLPPMPPMAKAQNPTIGGGKPVPQGLTPDQYVAPTAAPQTTMQAGVPAAPTPMQVPPMSAGLPPSPNQPTYAPQPVNPGTALPSFQQFGDAAYSAATRNLDPQFAQAEDRFAQAMVNKGLSPGTAAFDKERANFDRGKNDAYASAQNNSLLAGMGAQNQAWAQQFAQAQEGNRQGQFGDQFAFQNQRADMSDLMSLLGYGQQTNAQNNNYLNTDFNRAGGLFGLVPGMSPVQVDVMSPYQMQQQQNQFNSNQAANASNGLWSAAGQIGSAFMMSDKRVKAGIERVGKLDNGLAVYRFHYAQDPQRVVHIGLIAQEVEQLFPEAVVEIDGVKHVNYAQAVQMWSDA